jgi:hypothetical protein
MGTNMIDIDADTKKMRSHGWLRRPELDKDRIRWGTKLRYEVWELPDGRLHTRLWIIDPPNDPEYIGEIHEVKNRMGTSSYLAFVPR